MNKYKLIYQNLRIPSDDADGISLEELVESKANSIEYLNCGNILEIIDDPNTLFEILDSKLRLNANCYFYGVNIDVLCEYYLDSLISLENFNHCISNVTRLYNLSLFNQLINTFKDTFAINSIKTSGIYYQIDISRKITV